jgi:hypothetical protein
MEAICQGGQYDRKIVNVKPPVDIRVPLKEPFTDEHGNLTGPNGWYAVYTITGNLDTETGLPVLEHTENKRLG